MKDKIIWITGASSGIGEGLVYAYAEAGARLIISSRNRDALFNVKDRCKSNAHIHVLPLDLEQSDSLPEKAKSALAIYGRIDMLINAGGVSQRAAALETAQPVEAKIMAVNYWGSVILSKAVLPAMLAAGTGHIVCISSVVGKFGTKNRSTYAASKHALHGYFDSLRLEIADTPVKITLICPGYIKTNVSLNALTASGEAQGTMDDNQANGMPVDDCVKEIVKAVKAGKEEVYIGGKEVKGVWLKRFFPSLLNNMLKKRPA